MVKRSEESLVKLATLLIGILGVTALASSLAWGQGFSAEISGVVHDASGAVIPGVSVTAKHIESGLTRTAVTAGLANGMTLEVYTLSPEPRYKGKVRILNVNAHQAVARPVSLSRTSTIQRGDTVASNIMERP